MAYETIQTEVKDAVAVIRLNRPKALNALCNQLIVELGQALDHFEADEQIAVIVLTGSEKAFAAGADIKEIAGYDFIGAYKDDLIGNWQRVSACRKPIIAAVAGYALGGGCEIAMMCDFIIAADNAKFGQPEIKIGTIPGSGGTQRLTRAIGKAKAMEMVLTGRTMEAEEAERAGLVSRVVPLNELMDEVMKAAEDIASLSSPAVMLAKECVNAAFETTLAQGVQFERRVFHSTFGTADQKEGMAAFVEKRQAAFKNQ